MGFFGRIFGSRTTFDRLQQAYAQNNWAEVVSLAELCAADGSAEEQPHLAEMVTNAGNQLANSNLELAEACLRAGEIERAREHLELVLTHGRDEALHQRAHGLLAQLEKPDASSPIGEDCTGCGSGSSRPDKRADTDDHQEEVGFDEAWELTLAAMSPRWAERYGRLDSSLQQAVVLAHAGRNEEAMEMFLAVKAADRCEVVQFELACLYLRCGQVAEGVGLLQVLLETCPDHDLALQVAIDLIQQKHQLPWLGERLLDNLDQGLLVGLSHAGLARLAAIEGDETNILQHVNQALAAGHVDYELLVWASRIHEKNQQIDQAEAMLQQLPRGAGCGGAVDPLLGEFWLRHHRQPDQALNCFKAAARTDPENPRWALRIAQSYRLKGWQGEAAAMLTQILRTPNLDQQLKEEAEAALKASGK